MENTDRRYDIDWLRVIAIGLLLIYHIAIGFQPWGVFIKFIQNNNSLEYLWIPMTMLNIWRIPLLFFVSGMGVCFAMRKRTWKQLIVERTRRILLPLIFGVLAIVPLHILLWEKYYNQDLSYAANAGHLWFLANIFIYVILLSPIFFYLKKNENGALVRGLKKLYANPFGLLTVSIPFIIEAMLLNPETFELYATTLHGFLLGLLAFFFGFTYILSGEIFWRTVLKWRWLYLSLAIILYTIRFIVFGLKAPHYLMAIESTSWILAVLAFAYKYLNRPGKTLSYLSQAAYPVYILHMLFLYLASYFLFPLDIPAVLKLILVVFFTFISSFSVYELIIRKVKYIRPLFGLKLEPHPQRKILKPIIMKTLTLLISILSVIQASCENDFSDQWSYKQPDYINDGLDTGSLNQVYIDDDMIARAVSKIQQGKYKEVHSMLIYKDNMLVLEEYFEGHRYQWDAPHYHGELVIWDRSMPHEMMSVTKSFTSACIGIAIDKGFINSVHQSIFDYLPDHKHLRVDNREYITIEHLVTMTSGLAWDEWSVAHGSSSNDIDALWFDCEETIDCVLEKPWWKEPGQLFTYNGGGMAILGEIIKNATQMNIDEFSMKYLFEPMGIENTQWTQFPGGVWDGSGAFYITPRNMMKFGVMYLNKGLWGGERIISENWVDKSSKPYNNNKNINIPGEDSGKCGYGYTWWTSEFSHNGKKTNMFRAGGWGGQEIMVFPELDMVVVFTGGNYDVKTSLYDIIERFVLPAIN